MLHQSVPVQVFPPRAAGSRPPVLLQTLEAQLLDASSTAVRLATAAPHGSQQQHVAPLCQREAKQRAANLELDVHRQVQRSAVACAHRLAVLHVCACVHCSAVRRHNSRLVLQVRVSPHTQVFRTFADGFGAYRGLLQRVAAVFDRAIQVHALRPAVACAKRLG